MTQTGKPEGTTKPVSEHVSAAAGARGTFLLSNLGWILVITLAVVAGAALLSWSRTPMYRSVADVLVQPRSFSVGTAPQAPDMGTEKNLATSGSVLTIASDSLRVPVKDLQQGLSVTVPPDTRILRFGYTYGDPNEARRRAQSVAESYVKQVSSMTVAGTTPANMITAATLPVSPSSPNHALDLGIALVVGLILGTAVAAVRDHLDDRFRNPIEFETHAGAPLLGVLPALRRPRGEPAAALAVQNSPDSDAANAYRDLRTRLLQVAGRQRASVVLFTGPSTEPVSVVAANTSLALAATDRQVVLLSADLRHSQLTRLFDLDPNVPGLTSVVRGETQLVSAISTTRAPTLWLLPSGPSPEDPGSVLLSPQMQTIVRDLRRLCDILVIEAPGVEAGAETGLLAELADLVLLVGDARHSTRAHTRAALAELAAVGHSVDGCVLDNVGRGRRTSWAWRGRSAAPSPAPYPPRIAERIPTENEEQRPNTRIVV